MGFSSPTCSAPEIFPWGISGTIASCSGILRDNTSVSSTGHGEVAVGSEFISDSFRDSSEEDSSRSDPAGLHIYVFGVITNHEVKVAQKILWNADTYDLDRGLPLGSHSSSLKVAIVE